MCVCVRERERHTLGHDYKEERNRECGNGIRLSSKWESEREKEREGKF